MRRPRRAAGGAAGGRAAPPRGGGAAPPPTPRAPARRKTGRARAQRPPPPDRQLVHQRRRPGQGWLFGRRHGPPKLTPAAQKHFDAYAAAIKEGKVYRDDIGQCWPAGLPVIMTRVWPIAMIQLPTAIYMVSEFMNSLRTIYLDGRPHTDPDIVVRTFNGESIGRWEGDTLVVETKNFTDLDKHWVDQGVRASEDFRMIERYKLINNGNTLEIEWTLTDPKNWEGEWKGTRRWNRVNDHDIQEVECLPDLNEHLQSTSSRFTSDSGGFTRCKGGAGSGGQMKKLLIASCWSSLVRRGAGVRASFAGRVRGTEDSDAGSASVKEFRWQNPHTWIEVIVPNEKGKEVRVGRGADQPDLPDSRRLEVEHAQAGRQGDGGGGRPLKRRAGLGDLHVGDAGRRTHAGRAAGASRHGGSK